MKFPTAKTQIIAAAAVLLLLGGFTAALAYDGPGAAPFGAPSTSTQQSTSTSSSDHSSSNPTATTSVSSSASTTSTTESTTSTVTVCPLATSTGNPCCPPTASTASTAAQCCPPETSSNFQCFPHPEIFDLLLSPPQTIVTASTTPTHATIINPVPSGHAHISVQGNTLYVTVEVVNLTPLTQYSVNLDIDGTSAQLATLVTNQAGNGYIVAQLLLANGIHSVSVQVIGASSTGTTALALVSQSVTIVTPAPGPSPVAVTVSATAGVGDDK